MLYDTGTLAGIVREINAAFRDGTPTTYAIEHLSPTPCP